MRPAEGRRRSRRRRTRQSEARNEPARLTRERRHQRAAFAIGIFLLLVVFGVVSFGYYQEFYKPPRVWAGSVRNVEFTMGDLVQRIRVLQGISGQVDLSIVPFEYLSNLLDAEVLRQAAPGLGIHITDEDIDNALKEQFLSHRSGRAERRPWTTGRGVQEQLPDFPGPHRSIRRRLPSYRGGATGAPVPAGHHWMRGLIRLRSRSKSSGYGLKSIPWCRRQRGQSAAGHRGLCQGSVGKWQCRPTSPTPGATSAGCRAKAFPSLDHLLFGDEEKGKERLKPGEVGKPEFSQDGIYIVGVHIRSGGAGNLAHHAREIELGTGAGVGRPSSNWPGPRAAGSG